MINQPNHFSAKPVLQITAIWTLCFFFGPLAGWKLGEVLRKTNPPLAAGNATADVLLGLIFAETMSGLFGALILRNKLPGVRLLHIILIALGWGISGLILKYIFYALGS